MGEIWQSLSTHPHCVKITANRLLVLPEKPLDRLSVLFLSTTEHAESKPWFLGSLSRLRAPQRLKTEDAALNVQFSHKHLNRYINFDYQHFCAADIHFGVWFMCLLLW